VEGAAANIVVSGLPELFENATLYTDADKATVSSGGKAEFKITATEVTNKTDVDQLAAAQSDTNKQYIKLDVTKTIYDTSGIATTTVVVTDLATSLLDIAIPLEATLVGQSITAVYRIHEDAPTQLLPTPNTDGEKYSQDGRYVVVSSGKFSNYALAQDSSTPGAGNNTSGGTTNVPKTGDSTLVIILSVAATAIVALTIIGVGFYRMRKTESRKMRR
jgi:hypothetical protein